MTILRTTTNSHHNRVHWCKNQRFKYQVKTLLNLFWILDQSVKQFYFKLLVLQSELTSQKCSNSVLTSFSINLHVTALTCTAEALTNTAQEEADRCNSIAAKLPGNWLVNPRHAPSLSQRPKRSHSGAGSSPAVGCWRQYRHDCQYESLFNLQYAHIQANSVGSRSISYTYTSQSRFSAPTQAISIFKLIRYIRTAKECFRPSKTVPSTCKKIN